MTAAIGGRDLAGLAMDFDASPRTAFRGVQLQQALSDAFSAFGVPVRVTEAAAAREIQTRGRPGAHGAAKSPRRKHVDIMRPKAGETVWTYAQSIVKRPAIHVDWCRRQTGASARGRRARLRAGAARTFRRTIGHGTFGSTGNILMGREVFSIKGVPTDVSVYTARHAATASRRARSTAARIPNSTAPSRGFIRRTSPCSRSTRSGFVARRDRGDEGTRASDRRRDDPFRRYRLLRKVTDNWSTG